MPVRRRRNDKVQEIVDAHKRNAVAVHASSNKARTSSTKSTTTSTARKPAQDLTPGVVIDAGAFPHVIEAIIAHAHPAALLSLRAVSKEIKAAVDNIMPMHVVADIYSPPADPLDPVRPDAWGRVPGQGISMVPRSHKEPQAWIDSRAVEKLAARAAERQEFKAARRKAAAQVLEKRAEFDLLFPLAKFSHEYMQHRILHQATSAFDFFAPYVPGDADVDMDDTATNTSLTSSSSATSEASAPAPGTPTDGSVDSETAAFTVEKISREANNLLWQWKMNPGPQTAIDFLPLHWGDFIQSNTTTLPRRPYVIDVVDLPEVHSSVSSLRPRYLRYGPLVEIGYEFAAKDKILVLPLCATPLQAFFPFYCKSLIIALRIHSGPIRPLLLTYPSSPPQINSITLIFSPSPNLKRGSYMAITRTILRDIVDRLGTTGKLEIVDADSVPLAWFGIETEHKTTTAWMAELVDSVLDEHNKFFELGRRRNSYRGSATAKFLTKDEYMTKNKLTEAEYAIQRGD